MRQNALRACVVARLLALFFKGDKFGVKNYLSGLIRLVSATSIACVRSLIVGDCFLTHSSTRSTNERGRRMESIIRIRSFFDIFPHVGNDFRFFIKRPFGNKTIVGKFIDGNFIPTFLTLTHFKHVESHKVSLFIMCVRLLIDYTYNIHTLYIQCQELFSVL